MRCEEGVGFGVDGGCAVCGEAPVVRPSGRDGHTPETAALHKDPRSPVELLVVVRPDEQTLRAAGVERAAALALTYHDGATHGRGRPGDSAVGIPLGTGHEVRTPSRGPGRWSDRGWAEIGGGP